MAQVVIGIVISSILLSLLILTSSDHIESNPYIPYVQIIVFLHAVGFSAYNRIWTGLYLEEWKKLYPLKLDKSLKEKKNSSSK